MADNTENTPDQAQGSADNTDTTNNEANANEGNNQDNENIGLGNPEQNEKPEEENPEIKELFGKPENYDYKEVKLPDGMELNKETTDKFNSIAEKLNLSQKGANDLMALAVELTQQTQTKLADAYAQAFESRKAEFKEALKNDKEIGGAKLNETLKVANLAYEKFAPQEVQTLLTESGLNSHPQVVRMFHEIGKHLKEDTIHDAGIPTGTKKDPAEILYGNKQQQQQ